MTTVARLTRATGVLRLLLPALLATAAGGAYVSSTSATLSSTTCDWTGTSDNSLYDIVMTIYYFNYGNNASFTCSGSSCS